MPKGNFPITSFNSGEVSKLALARVDLTRLKFAAEQQINWVPRATGSMTLRPGTEYITNTKNDSLVKLIPFIFSNDDTAIIEITLSGAIRIRVDEELIARPTVLATIQNGDFGASDGWTLTTSGVGTTAQISSGQLRLNALAIGGVCSAEQVVAITDIGTEHAVRINVHTGPVKFRIGTTSGDDNLLNTTSLGEGEHSLAFTPTEALAYVQFESTERRLILVDSCEIEGAGNMELTHPWIGAEFPIIRWEQSGDIVYLACEGHQQRKLERRAARSWSFVRYQPFDGPFRTLPSTDVNITPSATVGNITLTASGPLFRSDHAGSLFRIFQPNQFVRATVVAEDSFLDPIRVTGVSGVQNTTGQQNGLIITGAQESGGRTFGVAIIGTWVGTATLQRSFDSPEGPWNDVRTYTANVDEIITDIFDNSVAWYRIGFKQGNYTSGSATMTLTYFVGGAAGVVRITSVTSPLIAAAEVLEILTSFEATRDWREGAWSDRYGYPTSVCLYEGRLWWFGKDRIWGSISDSYEGFDIDFEGDAGPVARSIGYGPVDRINWGLPLQRLILGLEGSEAAIRSTTFDEPLTPTNFSIKDIGTQGSAGSAAVKVDARGIFIQKSLRKVYQLAYSVEQQDYGESDLTALLPDIDSNLMRIAVQRQPDTRIHVIRDDGQVFVLLFEPTEEVVCWYRVDMGGNGVVEDICILPGEEEDKVYYVVQRSIGDEIQRFIERFSLESQNTGLPGARLSDAHVFFQNQTSATLTGLDHLESAGVVAWGWNDDDEHGHDLGGYNVSGGSITLLDPAIEEPTEVIYDNVVVGLHYFGTFKSAKLAYGAAAGTALLQKKRLVQLGLILHNTHTQGIRYGQDFDHLQHLSRMYRGNSLGNFDVQGVFEEFDEPTFPLRGSWDTDARLCLLAGSPRPVTILGAVIQVQTNDKG